MQIKNKTFKFAKRMMMMNAIEMRGIKGVMLTTLMSFITPVVIMGQDLPQNFVREIVLCEPDE